MLLEIWDAKEGTHINQSKNIKPNPKIDIMAVNYFIEGWAKGVSAVMGVCRRRRISAACGGLVVFVGGGDVVPSVEGGWAGTDFGIEHRYGRVDQLCRHNGFARKFVLLLDKSGGANRR